jgi:hypothetical protein
MNFILNLKIFLPFLFVSFISFSQKYSSIYFVGGKSFSTFNYSNASGDKDVTLEPVSKNNIGFDFFINNNRSMIRAELMLRQAGAKATYNGIPVRWDLNYSDFALDYFINLFKSRNSKGTFTFAPGFGFSMGYLLNGYQYINDFKYNLVEKEAFNKTDYMVRGMIHFRTNIAKSFFITAEYRAATSIKQIERADSKESTKNIHQGLIFGVGLRFH